ncbi:hypothetical protein [Massilia sp.]|uniref:hypothetical protein n=1 Tax=Massilia sp. TaxID=1882437 RepID=UPI00352E4C3E
MLEFIVFVILLFVLVPSVWLAVYRRAVGRGAGRLMGHVRGLIFSASAFAVSFVVTAIVMDGFSSTRNANSQASAKGAEPVLDNGVPATSNLSDASYAKFARMYQDRHLEDLENELVERHVAALKIIPALGGKSNVADVLTSRGIGIGRNADVSCMPMVKLANAPGCVLTVYLTRKKFDQQTDLSGVAAHWFMGVDENRFRPLEGWAQHVEKGDRWLDASGMLGTADTR